MNKTYLIITYDETEEIEDYERDIGLILTGLYEIVFRGRLKVAYEQNLPITPIDGSRFYGMLKECRDHIARHPNKFDAEPWFLVKPVGIEGNWW